MDMWGLGGVWVKNDSRMSDWGSGVLEWCTHHSLTWWQKGRVDFGGKDGKFHFERDEFEIPGRQLSQLTKPPADSGYLTSGYKDYKTSLSSSPFMFLEGNACRNLVNFDTLQNLKDFSINIKK